MTGGGPQEDVVLDSPEVAAAVVATETVVEVDAPRGTTGQDAMAVINEDPLVLDAKSKLHPALKDAMKYPLFAAMVDKYAYPVENFSEKEDLFAAIEVLNSDINELLETQVYCTKGYRHNGIANAMITKLRSVGSLLRRAGMYSVIQTSLKVFANTVIREAVKKPTKVSLDDFNFEAFKEELEEENVLKEIQRILDDGFIPVGGA